MAALSSVGVLLTGTAGYGDRALCMIFLSVGGVKVVEKDVMCWWFCVPYSLAVGWCGAQGKMMFRTGMDTVRS